MGRRTLLLALVAVLAAVFANLCFRTATAGAIIKGSPSPTPTTTPSPRTTCVGHVLSGARLVYDAPAVTASVSSTGTTTIFVGLATSGPAPSPTVNGGGATWSLVGTWWKKPDAPRDFSLFTTTDPVTGPLTITAPTPGKNHLAWSVDAFDGPLVSVTDNTDDGLETFHSVTFDHVPGGLVIAGFLVGQQGTVTSVAPYAELGQAHTSFITTESEVGDAQTAGVTWAQPGHAIGAAVETACAG